MSNVGKKIPWNKILQESYGIPMNQASPKTVKGNSPLLEEEQISKPKPEGHCIRGQGTPRASNCQFFLEHCLIYHVWISSETGDLWGMLALFLHIPISCKHDALSVNRNSKQKSVSVWILQFVTKQKSISSWCKFLNYAIYMLINLSKHVINKNLQQCCSKNLNSAILFKNLQGLSGFFVIVLVILKW